MADDVKKNAEAKIQAIKDAAAKENAKKTSEPVALKFGIPGFVDLAEISAIASALAEKDYFGAFKRAIRLLDNVLNESRKGGTLAAKPGVTLSGEEAAAFAAGIARLEKAVNDLDDDETPDVTPVSLKAPNKPEISIATVITIVNLVVDLVKRFKR